MYDRDNEGVNSDRDNQQVFPSYNWCTSCRLSSFQRIRRISVYLYNYNPISFEKKCLVFIFLIVFNGDLARHWWVLEWRSKKSNAWGALNHGRGESLWKYTSFTSDSQSSILLLLVSSRNSNSWPFRIKLNFVDKYGRLYWNQTRIPLLRMEWTDRLIDICRTDICFSRYFRITSSTSL